MRRAKILGGMLFATFMPFVAAHAEWLHKSNDNPFTGDTHTALGITDSSGYAVGFRCSKADDLALVFITPEKVTGSAANEMNALGVKLLIIVDDQQKIALDAELDVTPGDKEKLRLQASGREIVDLVEKVKSAKKRFALATEMMGQTFHPKSFDVRGSRRALDELAAGCKLNASERGR